MTIELPYTVGSLKKVLTWGSLSENSPFSHQDIADWCDRFAVAMQSASTDALMSKATRIAADVDAQWELYLSNTYSLEQLQRLDFGKVKIPKEWFDAWLQQLSSVEA